jgi:hypothetical protein
MRALVIALSIGWAASAHAAAWLLLTDGDRLYRYADQQGIAQLEERLRASGYPISPNAGEPALESGLAQYQLRLEQLGALDGIARPGALDRVTARSLGLPWEPILARAQPVPTEDDSRRSPDARKEIRRSYENSEAGEELIKGQP